MDSKRIVLLVDDDPLSREVISVLLEAEGYRVQSASGGAEALTLLSTLSGASPGIVLTDLQMPGLSGNELAKELRRLCGPSVSLLVMSAGIPDACVIEAYDAFLSKPFCVETFTRALQGLSVVKQQPSAVSPMLDEAVYQKLASVVPPQQLVQLYSFGFADALRRIEQMRSAARDGLQEDLRKEAHMLKGSYGMLGAVEIYGLARSIEDSGLGGRTSLELDAHLGDLVEACERLQGMLEARWDRR